MGIALSVYGKSSSRCPKTVSDTLNYAELFIQEEDLALFLPVIKKNPLPKLKILILSLDNASDSFVNDLNKLNAPNLKQLMLYGIPSCPSKMLKIKAFHNLSSLTFRVMSIPEMPEPISFPYLEEMHVNSSDLKDFRGFQKWHAPRLKEISLSRHVELQSFKGIDPFLKTLSTLSFTNMEIHSLEGLINKALPQLHKLAFNCVFSDRALKELQYLDLKNVKKLYLNIALGANATYPEQTITERKPLKDLTFFPSYIFT